MSDRNTCAYLWLSIFALLLAGCKTVAPPPDGWLPDADDLRREAFGAWIYLETVQGDTAVGEFIAVNDTNVYLLGYKPGSALHFFSVPRSSVTLVELAIHSTSQMGIAGVAIWAILGMVSTVTHGGYLILTAPLWLITGIPAIVAEANSGLESEYFPDKHWWSEWSTFARFPQGLPPGLNTAMLRPKP